MNRRRFLGLGLAGTLALGLGAAGVALQPGAERAPAQPLLALDARSFAVLVGVVEALCPGPPDPLAMGVPEAVDAFLATCDPGMVAEVRQALLFVENALPAVVFEWTVRRPFSACSLEQRRAVLDGFKRSRIGLRRVVYKALLGLTAATYYGDAATFSHTGYRAIDYQGLMPRTEAP